MENHLSVSKTPILVLLLSFLALFSFGSANAEIYYVSASGDNANEGLSPSTPLRTIKNAIHRAWKSGDIIYVMAGTYVETIFIWQDGITLSAYKNDKPVIDGQKTLPDQEWGALIGISGDNNTVSGFELKNSNITGRFRGGYGLDVTGHRNTISNMNVHHTWEHGILIHGDYNIVEDSTIWLAALHNSLNVDGDITSGWAAGLSASRNNSPTAATALIPGINSYTILRRNTAYNNWGEGITCYEADHCTMEDNVAYDNWTVNLYLSDATNSLVQRNLAYVSSAPAIPIWRNNHLGILLADEAPAVTRAANNRIINNLIYNSAFDAYTWSEEAVINPGLKNVVIANNIVIDGGFHTGGVKEKMVNINTQIKNNYFLGENNRISDDIGITFYGNHWADTPEIVAAASNNFIPKLLREGPTTPGDLTKNYFLMSTEYPASDPIQLESEKETIPPQDPISTVNIDPVDTAKVVKSPSPSEITQERDNFTENEVTSGSTIEPEATIPNADNSFTSKPNRYGFGRVGKKGGKGFSTTTFSDIRNHKPFKIDNAQSCRAYSNGVCLLK